MQRNIMFETERLIMREFTVEDTKEIYEYSQEESMKENIPDQVYETMDEARVTIDFLMSKYGDDLNKPQYPYVLGVVIKETQQLIGHVGLSKIPEGIEVGYAIGQNYQRKGYGAEAVGAFAAWAKEALKLPVIYAVVKQDNIASCKTLEKSGFTLQKAELKESFGGTYHCKIYTK
jgi:[ribosomal protein S5]-alanine N-acetyltransferase